MYDLLFKNRFGDLMPKGTGGRGYRQIFYGLFEIKLYTDPGQIEEEHFHLEIPGQACEFISSIKFYELFDYLKYEFEESFRFKRIDLAFDHVDFSPQQAYDAVMQTRLRSLAKRETLRQEESPLLRREDGETGTQTVYLGSNQSQRMVRVYNKRGFTRLELQTRDERSHLVACDLFSSKRLDDWYSIGISHLRDYVDFYEPWWEQFVQSQGRAYKTLAKPKEQSLLNKVAWFEKQGSPTLSVFADIYGNEMIEKLIDYGRKHRGKRFDGLLGKSQDDKESGGTGEENVK